MEPQQQTTPNTSTNNAPVLTPAPNPTTPSVDSPQPMPSSQSGSSTIDPIPTMGERVSATESSQSTSSLSATQNIPTTKQKKSPLANKGLIIGLLVAVVLVAGGVYLYLTMSQK